MQSCRRKNRDKVGEGSKPGRDAGTVNPKTPKWQELELTNTNFKLTLVLASVCTPEVEDFT